MIRTVSLGDEPGVRPLVTALEEEGFGGAGSERVVESFARHLMVHIDAWQASGFSEIARDYLARLAPEKGVRRDIDENGDLLIKYIGKADAERKQLLAALRKPSWLDPNSRGPR